MIKEEFKTFRAMDLEKLNDEAEQFANEQYNSVSNKRNNAVLFMKRTLKEMYIDIAKKHGQMREESEFNKWQKVIDAQRIQLSAQYQLPELSEVLEILDKHRHYEISDNTLLEMLRDKFTLKQNQNNQQSLPNDYKF